MSIPKKPAFAKLIVSLVMHDRKLFQKATYALSEVLKSVDMVSSWFPFDKTDYYANEMGTPLYRRLIAFDELIEQEKLVDIKLFTNQVENNFLRGRKRMVNVDPGYLLAERFVLATGKNYAHRIYLRGGIYADLTLIYQKNRYRCLDWTYPDYAGDAITGFLQSVRDRYMYQSRII